jgi:hypothetical protein
MEGRQGRKGKRASGPWVVINGVQITPNVPAHRDCASRMSVAWAQGIGAQGKGY